MRRDYLWVASDCVDLRKAMLEYCISTGDPDQVKGIVLKFIADDQTIPNDLRDMIVQIVSGQSKQVKVKWPPKKPKKSCEEEGSDRKKSKRLEFEVLFRRMMVLCHEFTTGGPGTTVDAAVGRAVIRLNAEGDGLADKTLNNHWWEHRADFMPRYEAALERGVDLGAPLPPVKKG